MVDNHPWMKMTDMEIIRSSKFYGTDIDTGRSGMTIGAALIFGNDAVIASALPAFKTDALLIVENLDRFDDRDYIRTNLIDSYSRLMAFIGRQWLGFDDPGALGRITTSRRPRHSY